MDVRPECIPCLLKRVQFQANLADNGREMAALCEAMDTYSKELRRKKNSAAIATEVHRSAYNAMAVCDPYIELKIRADEVASEYTEYARGRVLSSDDPIREAALMTVIGNVMDFGSGIAIDDPDEFRNEFEKLLDQGLYHDDTDEMIRIIKDSSTVIYIFDNCGESEFDKILIEVIQKAGSRVVGVVRGEPILNDVTMDDAKRTGLDRAVDRMLTTSQFAIGVDLGKICADLTEELSKADMIIAKGMANYESLSDQEVSIPLFYLLRSKCIPVAESLGVPKDVNVVILADK